MPFNVKSIKSYMENGLNVLITGLHGTGKTTVVQQACRELGWKAGVFNASTMDVYTDLVGVPFPDTETGELRFARVPEIDDYDVIVIDEINRGDKKTENGCMEMIQFKTLNGRPLKNLKVVVAMANPDNGDYNVRPIDRATRDRFHVYVESKPNIDMAYFKTKYGKNVATATKNWWNRYERDRTGEHQDKKNRPEYISPRRMDMLVQSFMAIPNVTTITEALPADANASAKELYDKLLAAKEKDESSNGDDDSVDLDGLCDEFLMDLDSAVKDPASVKAILKDKGIEAKRKETLAFNLVIALKDESVGTLCHKWGFALEAASRQAIIGMFSNWDNDKRKEMKEAVEDAGLEVHVFSSASRSSKNS